MKIINLKKPIIIVIIVAGYLLAAFGVAILVKFPLPYDMDFSMLYSATFGLVNGVSLYDHLGQKAALAQYLSVDISAINVPAFVYPPWLAISSFYLGYLKPDIAARAWFLINLGLIGSAGWLYTKGWNQRLVIMAIGSAILFLPSLGHLMVGQYVSPVLLGVVLLKFGLRARNSLIFGIGLALLTIKPHIGGIILLFSIIWLFVRDRSFFLSVLKRLLIVIGIAAGVSFLFDPAWPWNYFQSLSRFQALPTYTTCEICSSLSMQIVSVLYGEANTAIAFLVGIAIMVTSIYFLSNRYKKLDFEYLLAFVVLVVLLASPYLNNYDYLLLLIPFWVMIRNGMPAEKWIISLLFFLLPWLSLIPRDRNITALSLSLVSLFLLWMIIRKMRLEVGDSA